MKIQIFATKHELELDTASMIAQQLQQPGNLGFATGRTMEPIYAQLRALAPIEVKSDVWILDEYIGLNETHVQSYRYFLNQLVFEPLKVPRDKIHFPPLDQKEATEACQDYDNELRKHGGLTVQLLGLGLNGHIGLNEPGSKVNSPTRVVEIAEKTRLTNQSYFGALENVPTHAMTLGLEALNAARELWLIVTGKGKAEILQKVVEGEVTEQVPASLLRSHPGFRIFADTEAASLLS
jgi:glucosamine-6-phosphate deaminase